MSACTVPMGPRPPPPWPPRSPPITHPHTRHIHTHTHLHTHKHTHIHKHTRTLSHTDTHAHTCTHIQTNGNKNANKRTHNDTSMQTHTRMQILTHTNTHTAVKRWSCCREAPTHTRRITLVYEILSPTHRHHAQDVRARTLVLRALLDQTFSLKIVKSTNSRNLEILLSKSPQRQRQRPAALLEAVLATTRKRGKWSIVSKTMMY